MVFRHCLASTASKHTKDRSDVDSLWCPGPAYNKHARTRTYARKLYAKPIPLSLSVTHTSNAQPNSVSHKISYPIVSVSYRIVSYTYNISQCIQPTRPTNKPTAHLSPKKSKNPKANRQCNTPTRTRPVSSVYYSNKILAREGKSLVGPVKPIFEDGETAVEDAGRTFGTEDRGAI